MLRSLAFSLALLIFLSACGGGGTSNIGIDTGSHDTYTPVSFTVEGEKAIMKGTIDATLKNTLDTMLSNNPAVKTIEMLEVPGSADDEANLVAARIIRARAISTHVPAMGHIASGGVDFYLAGVMRTLDEGAKVGVHSWADGDGKAGSSYPTDHTDHKQYLDYYTEMGIPLEFYWFTLSAAAPEAIHYMTPEEIDRYGVTTN